MRNFNLNVSEKNMTYLKDKQYVEPIPESFHFGIREDYGGIRYKFVFPNGYGASVIKTYGSYGYDYDEWEIALMDSNLSHLIYIEDFEDDVIGYKNDKEIDELLTKISKYEGR